MRFKADWKWQSSDTKNSTYHLIWKKKEIKKEKKIEHYKPAGELQKSKVLWTNFKRRGKDETGKYLKKWWPEIPKFNKK